MSTGKPATMTSRAYTFRDPDVFRKWFQPSFPRQRGILGIELLLKLPPPALIIG
jgi:hypothetical protein